MAEPNWTVMNNELPQNVEFISQYIVKVIFVLKVFNFHSVVICLRLRRHHVRVHPSVCTYVHGIFRVLVIF